MFCSLMNLMNIIISKNYELNIMRYEIHQLWYINIISKNKLSFELQVDFLSSIRIRSGSQDICENQLISDRSMSLSSSLIILQNTLI